MTLSLEFHERVAAATHNPAVTMLIESFRGPILMSLREFHDAAPGMDMLGPFEHEQFVSTVRQRDVRGRPTLSALTSSARRTAARPGCGMPGGLVLDGVKG
jgi:GntR family transcriptional regulator, transcriptional repressor for pyruvate dehydrogenase complex